MSIWGLIRVVTALMVVVTFMAIALPAVAVHADTCTGDTAALMACAKAVLDQYGYTTLIATLGVIVVAMALFRQLRGGGGG